MGMSKSDSDSGLWEDAFVVDPISTSTSKAKRWPPGFRFHPTDEELIVYYLKRKICCRRLKPNVIGDTNVYKCEPWELPGESLLQTGDKQWYFFSPRDRKYPNGVRSNRRTKCGYWKATGKDRGISQNSRTVGLKKTLVFHNGHPPKGERTDWVMHEYTIDKKELKNCNTVQDSYAVYKIYQKSGPGPKNGEQYGAPFREEEWLDDDPFDDRLANPVGGENLSPLPELNGGFDQCLSANIVEEVLLQLADELEVNQQHVNSLSYVSQVDGEEGMQSSVVEPLITEAISAETSEVWQPCEHVDAAQTNFQIPKSVNSILQPPEVPDVASIPHGIDGDFMELNDLMDPEPGVSSSGSISNERLFVDNDGLYESDLYFDAPLFLPQEILSLVGTVSQPYFDSFSGDVIGQLDYHLPTSFDDENQCPAAHVTSQLWTHEYKNVFSSTESSQVFTAPSASGVVYDGNLVNISDGSNRGDTSEHWLTSAMNSVLESIPTNPASASENALISRAIERMSSFGAMRVQARDAGVAANMGAAIRREGRNGGFFFVSCLGALWAILWVLMIGTMVKLFKAFFGRYVAS